MTTEEVRAFLDRPGALSMATVDRDGSIQLVAMWYGWIDGDLAFLTKAKSQKVKNLMRDSRMTCMREDGTSYNELRGVTLVGHGEIVDDPAQVRGLAAHMIQLDDRRGDAPVDEAAIDRSIHNRVAIRLRVDRVVSWDHRKLTTNDRPPFDDKPDVWQNQHRTRSEC